MVHRGKKGPERLYRADETPPDWFLRGVECAALAPSAVNRQPVTFLWKDGSASAIVPDMRDLHPVSYTHLRFPVLNFARKAQKALYSTINSVFSGPFRNRRRFFSLHAGMPPVGQDGDQAENGCDSKNDDCHRIILRAQGVAS